ncbi:MAG: hypothetical protein NXI31_24575 [bacterium]|nr:hypothetical protein [bacterium]
MNPNAKRLATGLLGLVVVHALWGLLRLPSRVAARRLSEIAQYREHGAVNYFLGATGKREDGGAAAVDWLLENSAPNAVVLWRGETKGAFELASGLLAPRWLVHRNHVSTAAREYRGRPLAGDARGIAVLVGAGERVELEFR